MNKSQVEIVDKLKCEHKCGFIITGSYITITSSGVIRAIEVYNPAKWDGPYANDDKKTYIQFSLDSGSKWRTIANGRNWSGDIGACNDILLRTNASSAGYEMTLGVESHIQ